jgi:predicted nucleic acid-binding protein
VNLVDSCGWLEYFAGSEKGAIYASPIEDYEHLLVPSICILEVFKSITRQRGEGAGLRAAAAMQMGQVVALDCTIALEAARLGIAEKLPLADSIILATARLAGATVWTQGDHFSGLGGVRFVE